jgi:type II secretory pathway pseudopilin PulG
MNCRKQAAGFSLMEILIVLGMMSVVFLIVHRPLFVLLNYPKKTVHERADRVSGRLSYLKLSQELRNAAAGQIWEKTSADGKRYLLVPFVTRFDSADSNGSWDYALWVYDPESKSLAHKRWSQSELSQKGLPSPRHEPTEDEWNQYFSASVIIEAHHVQAFEVQPSTPSAADLQITFEVKNPTRSGRTDEYRLERWESL